MIQCKVQSAKGKVNSGSAVLAAVLVALAVCSGCKWAVPMIGPRAGPTDEEPEVTAPPPGQSTERRDPPQFQMPEA